MSEIEQLEEVLLQCADFKLTLRSGPVGRSKQSSIATCSLKGKPFRLYVLSVSADGSMSIGIGHKFGSLRDILAAIPKLSRVEPEHVRIGTVNVLRTKDVMKAADAKLLAIRAVAEAIGVAAPDMAEIKRQRKELADERRREKEIKAQR